MSQQYSGEISVAPCFGENVRIEPEAWPGLLACAEGLIAAQPEDTARPDLNPMAIAAMHAHAETLDPEAAEDCRLYGYAEVISIFTQSMDDPTTFEQSVEKVANHLVSSAQIDDEFDPGIRVSRIATYTDEAFTGVYVVGMPWREQVGQAFCGLEPAERLAVETLAVAQYIRSYKDENGYAALRQALLRTQATSGNRAIDAIAINVEGALSSVLKRALISMAGEGATDPLIRDVIDPATMGDLEVKTRPAARLQARLRFDEFKGIGDGEHPINDAIGKDAEDIPTFDRSYLKSGPDMSPEAVKAAGHAGRLICPAAQVRGALALAGNLTAEITMRADAKMSELYDPLMRYPDVLADNARAAGQNEGDNADDN
jgi:hypothetical protein